MGQYLIIFGIASLELWAAVPLGFVMKMNAFIIFLVTSAGAITASTVILFFGEKIKHLFKRKKKKQSQSSLKKKDTKLKEIWIKYGAVGLGLAAPWITGAPIGIAIGLALKADPKKLFFWTCLGIILCSALLSSIGYLGNKGVYFMLKQH